MAAPLPAWADEFLDLDGAADLAADCVQFLKQREARMGVEGSGLYNHYAQRLAKGEFFARSDLQMARFCAKMLSAFDTFVEVGCGVGELSLLIAQQGLKAIGIESDWKRAACAGDLKLSLIGKYPQIAANARIMYGTFPAPLPEGTDIHRCALLCGCLVATHTPEQALEFVREMHTYPLAIIDISRFLKIRRDPVARQELLYLLEAVGFEQPVPIGPPKDWDGEFVALTPRR